MTTSAVFRLLMTALSVVGIPGTSAALRFLHALRVSIFDPYRPEAHYMRGPGPKWREKHGDPFRAQGR